MNDHTLDALTSALPADVRMISLDGVERDHAQRVGRIQAQCLAESGYVLLHPETLTHDTYTIERLAEAMVGPATWSVMDEPLRWVHRQNVRNLLAALGRKTRGEHGLPSNPDDLLSPDERAALNDDLAAMARTRRNAEIEHGGEALS